jgi:hypothetical protein
MATQVPIAAARSQAIAAYALVDDEDYVRVTRFRWLLQGTSDAPRYVYRNLSATERQRVGRRDRGLGQEIRGQSGRLTFRNGNRLDFRKANLIGPDERQRRQEEGAHALRTTMLVRDERATAAAELALPSGWAVVVDAVWAERLRRFPWSVSLRGPHVYVRRVHRRANGRVTTITMARVLAGLQDLDEGTRLRPGVVTYKTPPDMDERRLDLRTTNLLVTTHGGINLRRPTRTRYRGVQRRGQHYRASIKIGGQERILGRYETPEAAAHARDAELRRLGLDTIARLQTAERVEARTGSTTRR